MVARLPKPNVPLLVLAMVATVLSAAAQPSGQSIIFSTPATDGAPTVTPALATRNSQTSVLPDLPQAPDPIFSYQAPDDSDDISAPPPPSVNPQSRRSQKSADERNDWTLQTPAEILGVAPMEELLHPPKRDALGRDENPTPLERYLDRQNPFQGGPTNGWQNDQNNAPWQFSRDRNDPNPLDPGRDSTVDAVRRLNEYLTGRRNGDVFANRNDNGIDWNSFNPPASRPAGQPDLQQEAAMERFRQLLDPSPAPVTASSPNSSYSPASKTAPVLDPYLNQPDFVPNPAGASFTPLTSGIGKPNGLTPLPGIVTPVMSPATAPSWAPQPAPWLSQGPQSGVMPQRKF